nr:MAG: ORF1 [TTV-like mini virus]
MPWRRNYYYRRQRRRYWNRYWRPRKTIWRRRRWRRRRQPVRRRKKLRYLLLKNFQPKCIRKCKIKGHIPLFWGPPERLPHNYELYEMSIAPEKIPSGGLFCIKNFSLEALYAEQKYCRNIWTKTNQSLPMMRYTGCKIRFYKSFHTDYVASYSTSLPLAANLDMYQTMHPGIHTMLQHKIMVPRKKYNNSKKPYITIKAKPPDPLTNKWYFQQDMASIPLIQIRASAASFDESYIDYRAISTTLNIYFLNKGCIQNSNFIQIPTSGYYCRKHNNQNIYLYSSSRPTGEISENTKLNELIFLGNTNNNQPGTPFVKGATTSPLQSYPLTKWGNPFYTTYLKKQKKVYFSYATVGTIANKLAQQETATVKDLEQPYQSFTETQILDAVRYNPFRDQGTKNRIFIQSIKQDSDTWAPPPQPWATSEFLPLWILCFGFEDFQKKNNKVKNIETEYMIVLQSNYNNPAVQETFPIIDPQFIEGKSPYENSVSPQDQDRWHPCVQMQQTTLTSITASGPYTPKQPPLNSIEAKIGYTFYFKWGGNLPQMEAITDPKEQPEIHLPTNLQRTNSLQNPADYPEKLLYTFDERRGFLTKSAIRRLQKEYQIKETPFTDGSLFQAPILKETASPEETTSEEEEETENLLLQLRKQQLKHKQLKQRILAHLGILPKSES